MDDLKELYSWEVLAKRFSLASHLEQIDRLSDLEMCLHPLRGLADELLAEMEARLKEDVLWEFACEALPKLEETWRSQVGFDASKSIFFLQGHLVKHEVLEPLLVKVTKLLKAEKGAEIQASLADASVKVVENRLSEYQNFTSGQDLRTKLSDSYKFCFHPGASCEYLALIKKDIERDFPAAPRAQASAAAPS